MRALPLVALPLIVGVVWTAAAAELLYGRINAVSLAFGTILVSIGIDVPIQLYNRLREELAGAPPLEALATTVRELAGPSLTATLAPAAVFFACALSSYRGLAELGVLAGVGLIFNWLAMLTMFPALLARLPSRWWARPAHASPTGGLLRGSGAWAGDGRSAVLVGAVIVGVAAAAARRGARTSIGGCCRSRRRCRRCACRPSSSASFGERDRALIVLVEDADKRARARARRRLARRGRAAAARRRRAHLLVDERALPGAGDAGGAARDAGARGDADGAARRACAHALEATGFDTAAVRAVPAAARRRRAAARRSTIRRRASSASSCARTSTTTRTAAPWPPTSIRPPAPTRASIAALRAFAAGPAGGVVTGAPVLEGTLLTLLAHDTLRVTRRQRASRWRCCSPSTTGAGARGWP